MKKTSGGATSHTLSCRQAIRGVTTRLRFQLTLLPQAHLNLVLELLANVAEERAKDVHLKRAQLLDALVARILHGRRGVTQ